MSFLICVITDIIHSITILMVCNMLFSFQEKKSEHKQVRIVFAGLLVSVISAIIYFFNNELIETLLYVIAITLLVYFIYRETIHSIIIITIWVIFALSMIDIMTVKFVDIFKNLFEICNEMPSVLVASFISCVMVYVVGRIYKKNASVGLQTIGLVNLSVFTVLLIADAFVVTAISAQPIVDIYSDRKNYLVAVIFVIIGIFIQLAAVIFLFMQRNVYKEKKQLTEKYLSEQKNYYEYLENREKETKKFRHDIRNHMELISSLVKNHEYGKIDNYLEQMHIKVEELGNIVTVQNGTVDAIINQYYAKAKQQGITMEVWGRFPEECLIDIYDICTIFSNVLSNALEAAVQTEEKYISVECRYTDRNIIIVVKNSYNSDQPGGNVQLKTRKGNVDYHGYGLQNMKDSIYKYKGVFDIETQDNIFTLKILFNNIGM